MCKLTKEQERLVNEILKKESCQTKVDKIVEETKLAMEARKKESTQEWIRFMKEIFEKKVNSKKTSNIIFAGFWYFLHISQFF